MAFDASDLVADRLTVGQRVAVCGCEAHICVLQTVIGLARRGFDVQVVADAAGSRRETDRELALRRMEKAGAEVISTEMLIFERLGSADHPRFKETMKIVK